MRKLHEAVAHRRSDASQEPGAVALVAPVTPALGGRGRYAAFSYGCAPARPRCGRGFSRRPLAFAKTAGRAGPLRACSARTARFHKSLTRATAPGSRHVRGTLTGKLCGGGRDANRTCRPSGATRQWPYVPPPRTPPFGRGGASGWRPAAALRAKAKGFGRIRPDRGPAMDGRPFSLSQDGESKTPVRSPPRWGRSPRGSPQQERRRWAPPARPATSEPSETLDLPQRNPVSLRAMIRRWISLVPS